MESVRRWSVRHAPSLIRVYQAWERALSGLKPVAGKKELSSGGLLGSVERQTKGLLFDCKMCGQCALSKTGLACPMNCAKQMRNGPCGGVRANGGCEVYPDMRCVWLEAGEGMKRISGADVPNTQRLRPVDHRRHNSSAWIQVARGNELDIVVPPEAPAPKTEREPVSSFEEACRSAEFVATVEIAPPDSADPTELLERADRFHGLVHGMNITDGAGGNCHMSSVAAASILAKNGYSPVCQVVCRDRNRIAVQGDVLGASALGVRNVLCLTGDDVSRGDHPQAKRVFDLDSISLLSILRGMRDKGQFASGRELKVAPKLFLGATANPFSPPHRDRIANLESKIDAGAEFIQTQFCFDLDLLSEFMELARARGLHERARFIIGVGTLSTAKALRWMAHNVPGVHIPDPVLDRIAAADDQRAEAKAVCVETIAALREMEGVGGIHLMGYRNEKTLVEILQEAAIPV